MSRRKTIGANAPAEVTVPHLAVDFKPKTKGQYEYVKTMVSNDVTFVTGNSGTGKSYLALGLAASYYISNKCESIIIARPAVEASFRGLGYIKGSLEEKLEPFLYPAIAHLKLLLGIDVYYRALRDEHIKFESLEYMRGRSYNDSFLVLEEAQNCTTSQLIMLVTRIGTNSKFVINGDTNQTDLRGSGSGSDLAYVINKVQQANLEHFGVSHLTDADILRSPLIGPFLKCFDM